MEAFYSSKTSVNIYQTARRHIPDDSNLHSRRRENFKSHTVNEELERIWKEAVVV
jgi:hypothetical protein